MLKNKRLVWILLNVLLLSVCLVLIAVQLQRNSAVPIAPENIQLVTAPSQSAALDHPDFIAKVSVPPQPAGTNVALNKKAASNGNTVPYTPVKALDGKTDGGFYWEGKSNAYPNELMINLGESFPISTVRIRLCPDAVWEPRTQTIAVSVSDDGESFTEAVPAAEYNFDPASGNLADIGMSENLRASYVRLSFTSNSNGSAGQAAEVEIYSP